MGQAEINNVADAIRAYVATHPSASDSIDGVLRWWLDLDRVQVSPATAAAALEQLVRDGILEWRRLPDGGRLYAARTARDR